MTTGRPRNWAKANAAPSSVCQSPVKSKAAPRGTVATAAAVLPLQQDFFSATQPVHKTAASPKMDKRKKNTSVIGAVLKGFRKKIVNKKLSFTAGSRLAFPLARR